MEESNCKDIQKIDKMIQKEMQNLFITNKASKYKLKHGNQFKNLLEPRDQVLQHTYNFVIKLHRAEIEREGFQFIEGQDYANIIKQIHRFLVEATSNVTSVAFKFLCEEKLTDNEAKEYAAKNIMLNIHSVFTKTIQAIENHPLLSDRLQPEQQKEIKYQLAIEVDQMLNTILLNLADLYPQAPASGGTPRMREAIVDIKRVEEEQNDHIFANDIKIKDFIDQQKSEKSRPRKDYTRFIMQVINTAITAVNSSEENGQQRTTFQQFAEFCERLFPLVQQEGYRSFISRLNDKQNQKDKKIKDHSKGSNERQKAQEDKSRVIKQEVRKSIVDYFSLCFQSKNDSFQVIQDEDERKEEKMPLSQEVQLMRIKLQFQKILNEAQKGAEALKKDKKYSFGQKIPAFVKEFNRQEIASKHFEAKHSSILRIMTKWAQNLQEIFQNPEKTVYNRPYAFKTTENQLVHVRQIGLNGATKLVRRLHEQRTQVEVEYKVLLQNCYRFISDILSQNSQSKGSVSRYSSTRTVASKINAVLTFLMLQYLNLLIHHLLQAGKEVETDYGQQNINLIVFRVVDLLRSKFQCTETQFISILKTLYVLDGGQAMKGKFKLVRIKNKLDDPANNIIINYLFMGRVQCQLQLSIQESKGKQKSYYAFSHFIYELIRGRFGVVAESAIMISQLDPMVVASRGTYYSEKIASTNPLKSSFLPKVQSQAHQAEENKAQLQLLNEQMQNKSKQQCSNDLSNFQRSIFNCKQCSRLVVNESTSIFKEMKPPICNTCRLKAYQCEKYLKNSQLKRFILEGLEEGWFIKLSGFQGIKQIVEQQIQEEFQVVAIVNDRGQLGLHMAIYVQQELRTLVVRVDEEILTKCRSHQFDFSSLDVLDLAKLTKKQKEKTSTDLIYYINDLSQVSTFLKMHNFSLSEKLKDFAEVYLDFRLEKTIIKSIKAKSEIFNANLKAPKIQKLGEVINIMNQSNQNQNRHCLLKYKKHRELDFSTVKQLHAESIGLSVCPNWLPKLSNLKSLNLAMNTIEQIGEQDLPSQLTHLFLYSNPLKSISIISLNNISQLYLFNNQLKSIELSHDFPHLRILYLYSNQLRSIDFSHSFPNLSILRIEDNQLRKISLSHEFLHLTELSFYNNQLEELILSKLPSLSNLQADSQVLINVDFSLLPKLQTLTVYNGTVSKKELKNLGANVEVSHHGFQ